MEGSGENPKLIDGPRYAQLVVSILVAFTPNIRLFNNGRSQSKAKRKYWIEFVLASYM